MRRATAQASSTLVAEPFWGQGMPSSSSRRPKRLRSSARSIFSGSVPIMGTPAFLSGTARFGRARIHAVEDGANSQLLAPRAHRKLAHFPGAGDLRIRDTVALGGLELLARNGGGRNVFQRALELDHLADLLQKPGVDRGPVV